MSPDTPQNTYFVREFHKSFKKHQSGYSGSGALGLSENPLS